MVALSIGGGGSSISPAPQEVPPLLVEPGASTCERSDGILACDVPFGQRGAAWRCSRHQTTCEARQDGRPVTCSLRVIVCDIRVTCLRGARMVIPVLLGVRFLLMTQG